MQVWGIVSLDGQQGFDGEDWVDRGDLHSVFYTKKGAIDELKLLLQMGRIDEGKVEELR